MNKFIASLALTLSIVAFVAPAAHAAKPAVPGQLEMRYRDLAAMNANEFRRLGRTEGCRIVALNSEVGAFLGNCFGFPDEARSKVSFERRRVKKIQIFMATSAFSDRITEENISLFGPALVKTDGTANWNIGSTEVQRLYPTSEGLYVFERETPGGEKASARARSRRSEDRPNDML